MQTIVKTTNYKVKGLETIYMSKPVTCSMFMEPVMLSDVLFIINKLKSKFVWL